MYLPKIMVLLEEHVVRVIATITVLGCGASMQLLHAHGGVRAEAVKEALADDGVRETDADKPFVPGALDVKRTDEDVQIDAHFEEHALRDRRRRRLVEVHRPDVRVECIVRHRLCVLGRCVALGRRVPPALNPPGQCVGGRRVGGWCVEERVFGVRRQRGLAVEGGGSSGGGMAREVTYLAAHGGEFPRDGSESAAHRSDLAGDVDEVVDTSRELGNALPMISCDALEASDVAGGVGSQRGRGGGGRELGVSEAADDVLVVLDVQRIALLTLQSQLGELVRHALLVLQSANAELSRRLLLPRSDKISELVQLAVGGRGTSRRDSGERARHGAGLSGFL
ncbi:hypothetical protein DFH06DRAFT_265184 [Mycena polygramma]|nr:hypothetical protein DFH06DRAFT_265184 [Mycena polygramma]